MTKHKYVLATSDDEFIIAGSNGEVTNASQYEYRSGEDSYDGIEGGLYSARIFGKYHKCLCGETKSGTCHSCEVTVLDENNEYKLYGYYRLNTKVIYEITHVSFLEELKKQLPNTYFKLKASDYGKQLILLWNTKFYPD